ncbi:unnamed protein product [Arabis nemorensis]|uniref:Uncharacterized protein n=1 Tax=Arabis nemorensis TaxID=586526 RepID=A0A565BQ48_9BRAS|nr:unnamed protein product [Arabis nemorensis]
MSSETESRSDNKTGKKKVIGNNNNSSENVSIAEHKILKAKYEALNKEHETLIKTLELLEITHGFTLENLEKKQTEASVGKKEVEKWKNKYVEIEKRLEKIEKGIKDLVLFDFDKNGVDSGTAENGNAKSNNVSDEGPILISDDDEEEGNERESNGGHIKSSKKKKPEFSFLLY